MTSAPRGHATDATSSGLAPDRDAARRRAPGSAAFVSALFRAGALTAFVDATFSTVLSIVYNGSATRVWKGVAATLLGPTALQGGARTTAIGLAMHVGVAFGWSAVFLALYAAIPSLRRTVASRWGVLKAASLYGPAIWVVMSLDVIPALVHRPPTINYRWWIQLVGHIFAVGMPMIWAVSRSPRSDR